MPTVVGGPSTPARAAAVLPFLERKPALHGIAISVLRAGAAADLTVVEDGRGEPLAVGLLTEIKYAVCRARDAGAVALLAENALRRGLAPPGWMGPAPEVGIFTEAWRRCTGLRARCALRLRIYTLARPPEAPAVPGRLRLARPADLPLLAAWCVAFGAETGTGRPGEDVAAAVAATIAARRLRVWEAGGRPVALAQSSAPPGPARVSLVYTPPAERRRGYAAACVAALSAELLASGHPFCYLYADVANPVANGVYRRIGYRPEIDVEDWGPDPA